MWGMVEITKLFAKHKEYNKVGKVYPIIGNHEAMPCDQFDVHSKAHDWIMEELTDMWGHWFTEDCKLCC